MINWVHRSTRGWSSGGSVTDPRTGEIIKATVTLGSLRDRQDYMIFEGLLSPYATGNEKPSILYETALARIRQLSAHEVGHTLGLGPQLLRQQQGLDLGDGLPASARGAQGRRHDRHLEGLRGAHRRLGQGRDQLRLPRVPGRRRTKPRSSRKILDDAWAQDLRYFTNQDTDIHPRTEQWSNGVNQADELSRLMKVRRAALNRIGEQTIRTRRADDDDRRAARADLHVSPLRGREHGVDDRRPGLRLRDARRRPDADRSGRPRRTSARRSRRWRPRSSRRS